MRRYTPAVPDRPHPCTPAIQAARAITRRPSWPDVSLHTGRPGHARQCTPAIRAARTILARRPSRPNVLSLCSHQPGRTHTHLHVGRHGLTRFYCMPTMLSQRTTFARQPCGSHALPSHAGCPGRTHCFVRRSSRPHALLSYAGHPGRTHCFVCRPSRPHALLSYAGHPGRTHCFVRRPSRPHALCRPTWPHTHPLARQPSRLNVLLSRAGHSGHPRPRCTLVTPTTRAIFTRQPSWPRAASARRPSWPHAPAPCINQLDRIHFACFSDRRQGRSSVSYTGILQQKPGEEKNSSASHRG